MSPATVSQARCAMSFRCGRANSHSIKRLVKNGLVTSVSDGAFSSESFTVINSF
jgi:hypothetical protein